MKKLSSIINKYDNARILDVGTGNGNFINILTSLNTDFKSAIGIDVLDSAIKRCEANFNNEKISFMQMDALNMSFEENSFDIVSLSNSLHHLDDISSTLKEMERVLAPGGIIIICEMISNGLSKKQKSHLAIHHFAAEIDRERGAIHFETFTDKEILNNLTDNSNLDIKDVWEFTTPNTGKISDTDIEMIFESIDRVQENIEGSERIEYYRKKADKIKNYVRKYGFLSAPQIIVVLKK